MKRPEWDEYFIEIAKVVSSRATCLRRRYGAVIVKDRVIVSTGYNGSPRGAVNCIDSGICRRQQLNVPPGERYELCVAVHAEQNAMINGPPERMKGATIYIAGFEADGSLADASPCLLCRRMIRNAQMSRVVYLSKSGEIITVEDPDILAVEDGVGLGTEQNIRQERKGLDIKEGLDELYRCEVLTKRRLREFLGRLLEDGPGAARKYIERVHYKNPNTGYRRWNRPSPSCAGTEEEEEALYEKAYRVLHGVVDAYERGNHQAVEEIKEIVGFY